MKRMFQHCGFEAPSRYQLSKLDQIDIGTLPEWSIVQDGIEYFEGKLIQRLVSLGKESGEHATAHYLDGQASEVNQNHSFLQRCYLFRHGQLRQYANEHQTEEDPYVAHQDISKLTQLATFTTAAAGSPDNAIAVAMAKAETQGSTFLQHYLKNMTVAEFCQRVADGIGVVNRYKGEHL